LFPLLASFEASALFESERILKKGAGFLRIIMNKNTGTVLLVLMTSRSVPFFV
jgi:hypothetical protein